MLTARFATRFTRLTPIGALLVLAFGCAAKEAPAPTAVPGACGNGVCGAGEDVSCPQDCTTSTCNNQRCDTGDAQTCPAECPAGANQCGNLQCEAGEKSACPGDCPAQCGDAVCDAGEDESCPDDCGLQWDADRAATNCEAGLLQLCTWVGRCGDEGSLIGGILDIFGAGDGFGNTLEKAAQQCTAFLTDQANLVSGACGLAIGTTGQMTDLGNTLGTTDPATLQECFDQQQCGAEVIFNTISYATEIQNIIKTQNKQAIANLLQPQIDACTP